MTGSLVFDEPTPMRTILAHVHDVPEPPSSRLGHSIGEDLESVIMRCLQKDPKDRPGSARELAGELAACRVPPWTDHEATEWWDEAAPRNLSGGYLAL